MHISYNDWIAMPWWLQQIHLEGMAADEEIPFTIQEPDASPTPGMQGPTIRKDVDAGVKVIDLAKMREELEELRRQDIAQRQPQAG